MIEKLNKIYMNRTLFIVSAALTTCCYIAAVVTAMIDSSAAADLRWIMLGLTVMLLWAFFKGETNVQKVTFGAILIAMIEVQCELLKYNEAANAQLGTILGIINLILSIIVFVSHMIQQTDHKGSGLAIVVNQSFGVTAILFLITVITNLIAAPTALGRNVFALGYVFNCILLICMETRVYAYKQIRDEALADGSWTDEKKQEARKLFKI